jgi:hypothetical protein
MSHILAVDTAPPCESQGQVTPSAELDIHPLETCLWRTFLPCKSHKSKELGDPLVIRLTFMTEIDYETSETGRCNLLVDDIRRLTLIGRRIVQSYM